MKCATRQSVSWMVGRSRGGSETGFLSKIGRQDVEIIAETRFLGWLARPQKPGFYQIGREDAKIIAETRFLGQRGFDF